jgi:hypothetical protein
MRPHRSNLNDFPNSEFIKKHIQDVDAVQKEIEQRMQEHQ